MNRVVAWVVCIGLVLLVLKGCAVFRNPWSAHNFSAPVSSVSPAKPGDFLYIPGCGNKPECRQ
jgi:hypothetical protein